MQCSSEWPSNYLILSCAVCNCISVEKLKVTHPCFPSFVFVVLFLLFCFIWFGCWVFLLVYCEKPMSFVMPHQWLSEAYRGPVARVPYPGDSRRRRKALSLGVPLPGTVSCPAGDRQSASEPRRLCPRDTLAPVGGWSLPVGCAGTSGWAVLSCPQADLGRSRAHEK